MNRQPMDEWFYTGAGATYGTFNNAAAAAVNSADPPFTTDLTDTAHGLLAGSLLYIQGSTNYNGLKKMQSVPDANSMYIYAKYVAETLAGTETWKTMFTYDTIDRGNVAAGCPWEFLGFEATLSAAGATASEYLTIITDAAVGSAYDNEIYRRDMNGVQYINYMFDEARKMSSGDKIDVAWANAGAKTWGIKLFTRRLT